MTRQLISAQEQENLEIWLERRHFRDNPFGTYQAELEERLYEYFDEYFVSTAYYDEIRGTASAPRTTVVFAARGCGKSAHRIMVTRKCRPMSPDSDILAISYTDFGHLPDEMASAQKSVQLSQHLNEILRAGTDAFLEAFVQDPELVEALEPEWLSRLKWFCTRPPGVSTLPPSKLLSQLRRLAGESFNPDWEKFRQAWHTGKLEEMLRGQAILKVPAARFLVNLADAYPEPVDTARLSAARLFGLFVDLVCHTGLRAVYVFIDRMDEIPPLADQPALVAEFVEPLLANLPLMECPNAAFKFFLPLEAQSALLEKTTIRYDRLQSRDLIWDDSSLAGLLKQRLIVFSGGEVEALADLCDETEVRRGWNLDQELVRHAQGSPRNLLRLGEMLFWAHFRQPQSTFSLTQADWKLALSEFYGDGIEWPARFQAPLHPPLRLDKTNQVVWIGTKKVEMADAPFSLLSFLYDRAGRTVRKAELFEVEGSLDNLYQLVRRVRQEIEPDPKHPVYLVTIRGQGLRLDNVRRS